MLVTVLAKALMAAVVLQTASATHSHAEPEANTPLGKLRGHTMTSRGGRRFLAFSGVPYAKPPVGELTFQAPEPLEPWNGVREAKENGPWCLQYNLYEIKPVARGVQDCLYLSVYTHKLDGRAPVLVHFHGGGFISGNGANKTGPQYLMDEDVVVVNVNYRLGIFGFLSFEDRDLPGNQGLKDQSMALRWVQQNIASFGGDPNKVTLVGESAGAGSVYLHTLSPLSKGLFHRAIAESGSAYALWSAAVKGFTRNLAMKLLEDLGVNYTDTKAAVELIRRQDPVVVASKLEIFREWQIDPIFNFGPVLEESPGAFITGPVSKWKQLTPVPLLMGTTSAEGLLRTDYIRYFNTSFEWYSENFERLAPISLMYFASASDPDKITKAVRNFYFQNHEITENDWRNLTYMYGDSWLSVPTIDGANNYSGDVYFYYFDYVGDQSWSGNSTSRNDTIAFGATHNEELVYIWKDKYINNFQGKDLEVSKKLVKIWTDFAKYGNPTPRGSDLRWDKWTVARNRYMDISKAGFAMKEGLLQDRYRFWKSINYRDKYD